MVKQVSLRKINGEHEKSVQAVFSSDSIKGKIEIVNDGIQYHTAFELVKGGITVTDSMVKENKISDMTIYWIRGSFIEPNADSIELAAKRVVSMLATLSDYQVTVDDSMKVVSKNLSVEIKGERIYLRSNDFEVKIKSETKKYFEGDKESKVLNGKERTTAMNMIYLIIVSELDYLLPLVATIKTLAGVE